MPVYEEHVFGPRWREIIGSIRPRQTPWWHALVRFTLPGYVVALAISLFSLWIFEQVDGSALMPVVFATIVLGFPAAIGAAAARLIL